MRQFNSSQDFLISRLSPDRFGCFGLFANYRLAKETAIILSKLSKNDGKKFFVNYYEDGAYTIDHNYCEEIPTLFPDYIVNGKHYYFDHDIDQYIYHSQL